MSIKICECDRPSRKMYTQECINCGGTILALGMHPKIPVKKRFAKFLKDEGVFYLYWHNVRMAQKSGVWAYKEIIDSRNYLRFAFRWGWSDLFGFINTDEKRTDFWLTIHYKWLDTLKSEGYAS